MQYWHPLQVSQDKSFIQKKHDDLQNYNKCSRDSSSALQKAHKGDSTILKRWTFQFISEIIRLKILYWNSLRLVSNVVSKLKGNNFFQSLLSLGALYTNTLNQIDLMVWRPFQSYISFKSPPSPLYYPLYVVGRIYHTS